MGPDEPCSGLIMSLDLYRSNSGLNEGDLIVKVLLNAHENG